MAAVAALVWSPNPYLANSQVWQILNDTAERRGNPPYPNLDFGWGMVDAAAAVDAAISDTAASLMGFVLDANSWRGINMATVEIQSKETGSNDVGHYEFPSINTGTYTIEVTHPLYFTRYVTVTLGAGPKFKTIIMTRIPWPPPPWT